jgi:hypothetical protein
MRCGGSRLDALPAVEDLAGLLRQFHSLPAPPFELPAFDPFAAVPARLRHAAVDDNDLRPLDGVGQLGPVPGRPAGSQTLRILTSGLRDDTPVLRREP